MGVSRACRELGYHRSSYYRLRRQVERQGLEMLRQRERRLPRMPNQVPPWLEERVVAFSLGHPGLGLRRIAMQLAQPMWGGLQISASGVFKVLRRHGLNTRRLRLSLVAGYTAALGPTPPPRLVPGHLEADQPGELVQLDCFHIGRLPGTRGRVWQYTAIDVASSFTWAELHVTPLNPALATPRGWCAVWPQRWPRRAGSCRRCPPTTALSSAPRNSAARWSALARSSDSFARADRRPTAVWSACSAPSSRAVHPSAAHVSAMTGAN